MAAVFSPLNASGEEEAGAILQEECPDVAVTLSHRLGRIGLLERENAAIMNACLRDLSRLVIEAFREAIATCGIKGRFFLTQNDGTLMDAAFAEKFPVLTFASGPTNSMRGAAFLSGVSEAIVVDIGGTTTDVGSLHKGFPRQATVAVEVGGVRTNFRMPDVFSIGLGGGSLVVDGEAGVKALAADARALDNVRDTVRHCKPLLVLAAGVALLKAAGVPEPDGSGVSPFLAGADPAKAIDAFVTALGGPRNFARETDPPRV